MYKRQGRARVCEQHYDRPAQPDPEGRRHLSAVSYTHLDVYKRQDFAFFQNRCTLEGAAFLVYDGKLVVYDEARMESQQPVDTITITPANDFEYRDEGTNAYGSAEAVNGGLIGTFTAPSGGDKVLRRILPFRMTDQSEEMCIRESVCREPLPALRRRR